MENNKLNKQIEQPSLIYLQGLDILRWSTQTALKSAFAWFLWNHGITRIHMAIPHLPFLSCLAIIGIVYLLITTVGEALWQSAGVKLADALYLMFVETEDEDDEEPQEKEAG